MILIIFKKITINRC